jgi:hypothetical protein
VLADKTARLALVAIAAGVVLILGVGFVAPAVVPRDANGRATGATLGSTGFAYLSGLRTFAAALLWNRIEPEFHTYYGGVSLEKQRYMLPTIRMVTWLDPQFVEAYYVGQWIVARSGKRAEAYALTQEGIRANPHSGLLLSSYAQLRFLYSDIGSAHKAALLALSPDVKWSDALEQWQSLALLRPVFKKAGDAGSLTLVAAKMKELDAEATRLATEKARSEFQEQQGLKAGAGK